MLKHLLIITGGLLLLAGVAWPQDVVIRGFPVGVGGSVDESFFEPYYPELQALADTLMKYPRAFAIVTGGADGIQYREHHDAKNPSLALGRAHILRNLLISRFNVDSLRVMIQSVDVAVMGPEYRSARIRVVRDLDDLEERLEALENRPPVEKHFTEVKETPTVVNTISETFGLQFSAGVSTSPFGGIPMVAGALSWKRTVYAEAIFGHTFWNNEYEFMGVDLDTKRRLAGAQMIVFPVEKIPVGVVGGWVRVEEIAQPYYKYVKLSEGLMVGLRVTPLKFIAVTGTFNPSKHREAGKLTSPAHNDQFMLTATAFIEIGGGR